VRRFNDKAITGFECLKNPENATVHFELGKKLLP
jgi:hypothetical protein